MPTVKLEVQQIHRPPSSLERSGKGEGGRWKSRRVTSNTEGKYENDGIGALDYACTKAFSNLMLDASNVNSSNENCVIPANSFSNMFFLQSVILPYRASQIGSGAFANCVNLKEVALPLYLESMGSECFTNCTKLKNIQFPKTLNEIGERCFNGCNSLETVDLSQCDFTPKTQSSYRNHIDWNKAFGYCANLQELKFPQGITRIMGCNYEEKRSQVKRTNKIKLYFPSSLEYIKDCWLGNSEQHFMTATAPYFEDFYISNNCDCKVYCPKGSVTSYYNAIGRNVDRVKIIEE